MHLALNQGIKVRVLVEVPFGGGCWPPTQALNLGDGGSIPPLQAHYEVVVWYPPLALNQEHVGSIPALVARGFPSANDMETSGPTAVECSPVGE